VSNLFNPVNPVGAVGAVNSVDQVDQVAPADPVTPVDPVLEVENLSLRYREKRILKGVSFSINPGEFVSIIGPNGSGKTTLVKAISRTLIPETGQIRIKGTDVQDMSHKTLARNISVVMQSAGPVAMDVDDYVLLGRQPFFQKYQFFETQKDLGIAKKYMELTNILQLSKSKINQISGGERQLASIARALTQEPILLILDEPTSHLDITHQVQVLELIRSLQQTLGLTILMVLHDLNLAAEYSDRLILLNKDQKNIYGTGTPEQVLTERAIQEVYHTRVMVQKNPVSGKPCIFLVTQPMVSPVNKEG
jgi:iron complex transport system ATP-binding protein